MRAAFVGGLAMVVLAAVAVAPAAQAVPVVPGTVGCPAGTAPQVPGSDYRGGVEAALASGPDIWGREAIAQPQGPSYDEVARHLKPIRYGVAPAAGGSALGDSGGYYVPFGQPAGPSSREEIALHMADGSQIISNKSGNRSTRVFVGTGGEERFGECPSSLAEPGLLDGHLPVLETAYTDRDGVAYRQESFATMIPGTQELASYVKITAERAATSVAATKVRFQTCDCNLAQEGDRLVADGKTYLYVAPGATLSGRDLSYELDLSDGAPHSVYVIRVNAASATAPVGLVPGEAAHMAARGASIAYWQDRLAEGATFSVPERRIMDAQRNMLVQNLQTNWRYSLGNAYEAFYQPESSDTVENLGHYGFTAEYEAGLTDLLPKSKGVDRRNWEMGEKLLRAADLYWLTRDPAFVDRNTPVYAAYAEDIAAQQRNDPNGLLEKQRYSSDIPQDVYGLHQISRALYGLKAIVAVWRETGHVDLADRYAPVAASLDAAVHRAMDASNIELSDGSVFTAVMLYEGEPAYDPITDSTLGGYWNLVAPYVFGSKLYEPGSEKARRAMAYLYDHGSRLAGSLRARLGGIDDVYGTEQVKFLADNDEADEIALTMYGNLAQAHTPGTFIAGEADNVGPIGYKWPLQFGGCATGVPCDEIQDAWTDADAYRGMYNPPNSASNTLFLTALRLMLVQEVTDAAHVPHGLRLGFSTPRAWLADGKRIDVRDAPTSFGAVSYRIESELSTNRISATVDLPSREQPESVQLRLRAPHPERMLWVKVNGRQYDAFDPDSETIDLTGLTGTLDIEVHYGGMGRG